MTPQDYTVVAILSLLAGIIGTAVAKWGLCVLSELRKINEKLSEGIILDDEEDDFQ